MFLSVSSVYFYIALEHTTGFLDWSHFLFYTATALSLYYHNMKINHKRFEAFFKNCLRSTSSKWIPCCLFYFENMHNCNAVMNRDCSFRVSHRPNIYFRCLNPKGRGGGAENSFKHWEPAAARALNSQNISQVCNLADWSVSCMSKQRFDSEK